MSLDIVALVLLLSAAADGSLARCSNALHLFEKTMYFLYLRTRPCILMFEKSHVFHIFETAMLSNYLRPDWAAALALMTSRMQDLSIIMGEGPIWTNQERPRGGVASVDQSEASNAIPYLRMVHASLLPC